MLANFIESSPLPVKAVLAMMGKIEEVYRLPLLPMRRDTRSKVQKIATDAGLITSPRVRRPPRPNSIFTRIGQPARTKRFCIAPPVDSAVPGKGRPAGHDPNHSKWHGPYGNLAEAREATHQMPGVLIRSECKCVA
jgi:hypothetical protein